MALFPPADCVVGAAKLVPSSQLEHQNNLHREFISDKEEILKDLCARKSQSYSYSQSAESRHGGFGSAGLQSNYLTGQTKILPAKLVARQKKGVDRSYPLKPIPHKGVNVVVFNTSQLRSSPCMEEVPNGSPSSMSKQKPPAGRSQLDAELCPWTAESEQSASHLHRREQAYILKLEADGQNLEEEIRKKEALLREKLRKTKEELRRIQREKELIEREERRDREAGRTHEQKATRHPEEKMLRVAVRPSDGVFTEVQSAEPTVPKPGTPLQPHELARGKLKKERLVASNSKIQDHVPMEHLASCSNLAPKCSPSSSALSDQDPGGHLSPEVLYMQPASTAEHGELGQCSFCGRKFFCARLETHMNICSKSQGSKRKVFDSRKARAKGTELEQYQQSSAMSQNEPSRKNNRRQKHKSLIQTLCQTHQVQQVLSKGGNVSDLPLLPPIENPGYVTCPYCSRRFAPRAAERHIPKCRNIKNRPPPPRRR
ncbi:zinc finger C2HC domain-containing protein 1C [Dryobates pubescens]|uniref:zinc finger C2HC domain-containing protein 1C n=1 Tax=Dryobates pubescens TaxID=118200 RepID=UPI0023B8E3C8|nr:zinc finger C2HC domain-containing protein 1C [Dryobates pubescens]